VALFEGRIQPKGDRPLFSDEEIVLPDGAQAAAIVFVMRIPGIRRIRRMVGCAVIPRLGQGELRLQNAWTTDVPCAARIELSRGARPSPVKSRGTRTRNLVKN